MSDEGTRVFRNDAGPKSSSSDESSACIVFLHPSGPMMGKRVVLAESEYILGRSQDARIVIDSDSVSRKHATLFRIGTQWMIEDMGSTNGVFVNDAKTKSQRLRAGDIVRMGEVIFKFLHGDDVEAAYHEEIHRLTITDALTGAANKRHFLQFLERELASGQRHTFPVSLAMMDIDHFKKINDVHGHLAGDAVLRELGARIGTRTRREDLFARYGGEEFAVVLTHTSPDGARLFAEAIRQLIEGKTFTLPDGQPLRVTVSVGVATFERAEGRDVLSLIQLADERLYRAKQGGRNRVVSE